MEKLSVGAQIELKIDSYAFGGKGIARLETENGSKVVFVQNALPGQLVLGRVVKAKRRYAECKLVKVLQRSPNESDTPFQDIPGAPYSHLSLSAQQQLKKESALDLYARIGKIEGIAALYDEWIDAPEPWHYRNKMEYSFSEINSDPETDVESDVFSLGFKRRGTWWAVENLNADSGLFDAGIENNLHQLRTYLENTGLRAWNPRKREGFFKNLIARKSFFQDAILLNLVTGPDVKEKFNREEFVAQCLEIFGPRITGIFHAVNEGTGDRSVIPDKHFDLIYGEPHLIEQLHGLEFEIGIKSFFQPNPHCAERLYAKAMDYVGTSGQTGDNPVILDLFCGTGTISQLLAQKFPAARVIGVDIEPMAIADAQKNAERNEIRQIEFFAGDVGRFLFDHPELNDKISVAVMDPPRAGIAPKTLRKVIRLQARSLVYISCNPATQARDCEILAEAGYVLKKLSLVDQFPHTAHVEAVALFELTTEN
jgi:23S rRNA (uracil1939-C5)-methyltransferase